MAMKKKITKAEHDALSDEFKAEYKKAGKDFVLDVDDDDGDGDTGELRRANDRLKQEAKDAKKEAAEAKRKLAEIDGDDARKSGDITKIEASWQKKVDDEKAASVEALSKLQTAIKKERIETTALNIAKEISKSPKALARVLADRITVDFEGDEPTTVILDKNGKPSRMSVDDLKKEVSADPDFKDIIVASKASGGGAPQSGNPGKPGEAGNSQTKTTSDPPVQLHKLSPQELAAHIKAKKDAAQQGA